jgi:hypothetical protein
MPNTKLILTPDQVAVSVLPEQGMVFLELDLGQWDQFLEHELAIRMTPEQARQIAAALNRKADAAESGSRRG